MTDDKFQMAGEAGKRKTESPGIRLRKRLAMNDIGTQSSFRIRKELPGGAVAV
jgi:hypothetical protein